MFSMVKENDMCSYEVELLVHRIYINGTRFACVSITVSLHFAKIKDCFLEGSAPHLCISVKAYANAKLTHFSLY